MSDSREDQFGALYGWTHPRIVAYALRRTASREDAADVVAETFEVAWRRFDDIPSGDAALLWLYGTARYVLANQLRRGRRRGELVKRLAAELLSIPVRAEALDEQGILMASCLRSLPADDREVLMLAAWEGLSASEIGRLMDCSPTAARIRLHRARTRLKDSIAELSVSEKRSGQERQEHGGGERVRATSEEVMEQ